MSLKRKIAFAGYCVIALLLAGFGARYYWGGAVMPYHLQVLGVPWESLAEGVRFMFLGFMRAVGSGFLTASATILLLLFIPYRRSERWASWALFSLCLYLSLPRLFSVLRVAESTSANPPIIPVAATLVLTLLCGALTLFEKRPASPMETDAR